jgi:hypothetical protein
VGKVTLIFYSCGQISLDGFFNNGFSRREVILAIRSVADSEKKRVKKGFLFLLLYYDMHANNVYILS